MDLNSTPEDVRDLYLFVQRVVENRGWHSCDSHHSNTIFQASSEQYKYASSAFYLNNLSSLLTLVDGIMFTVTADGLVQNIYGDMTSFIDYSRDEIETIYELLDAENSDCIRQYLKQVNSMENNNYINHRIKFRIKPTPQTPKEKHKYCTMDCYFTLFHSKHKSSSSCLIFCLRNEWLQIYINTAFPRTEDNNELSFWGINKNGQKEEKSWVKNMQVVQTKDTNSKVTSFLEIFKLPILYEIIGSHSTESAKRMNDMWKQLRQNNTEEVRNKSIIDSKSMANSSDDVEKLGGCNIRSFLSTLRYFFSRDIDEEDINRLRLMIETRSRIKEVQKVQNSTSTKDDFTTRQYLKYTQTQTVQSVNLLWLEFLHQISIPAEIFDFSEKEVTNRKRLQQLKECLGSKADTAIKFQREKNLEEKLSGKISGRGSREKKSSLPLITKLLTSPDLHTYPTEQILNRGNRSKSFDQPKQQVGKINTGMASNRDRSRSTSNRPDQDSPLLKSMLQSTKSDLPDTHFSPPQRPNANDFLNGPRDTGLCEKKPNFLSPAVNQIKTSFNTFPGAGKTSQAFAPRRPEETDFINGPRDTGLDEKIPPNSFYPSLNSNSTQQLDPNSNPIETQMINPSQLNKEERKGQCMSNTDAAEFVEFARVLADQNRKNRERKQMREEYRETEKLETSPSYGSKKSKMSELSMQNSGPKRRRSDTEHMSSQPNLNVVGPSASQVVRLEIKKVERERTFSPSYYPRRSSYQPTANLHCQVSSPSTVEQYQNNRRSSLNSPLSPLATNEGPLPQGTYMPNPNYVGNIKQRIPSHGRLSSPITSPVASIHNHPTSPNPPMSPLIPYNDPNQGSSNPRLDHQSLVNHNNIFNPTISPTSIASVRVRQQNINNNIANMTFHNQQRNFPENYPMQNIRIQNLNQQPQELNVSSPSHAVISHNRQMSYSGVPSQNAQTFFRGDRSTSTPSLQMNTQQQHVSLTRTSPQTLSMHTTLTEIPTEDIESTLNQPFTDRTQSNQFNQPNFSTGMTSNDNHFERLDDILLLNDHPDTFFG